MSERGSGRAPSGSDWSAKPEPQSVSALTGDHSSRGAAYFPEDLRGAHRLGWIAGFYGPELPPGVAQELINLAYQWEGEAKP